VFDLRSKSGDQNRGGDRCSLFSFYEGAKKRESRGIIPLGGKSLGAWPKVRKGGDGVIYSGRTNATRRHREGGETVRSLTDIWGKFPETSWRPFIFWPGKKEEKRLEHRPCMSPRASLGPTGRGGKKRANV